MIKKLVPILIFLLLFGYIAMAQEDDLEVYIVTNSVKVYDKPTKFSKVTVVEGGSFLVVNQYFENESFKEISHVRFENEEIVEVYFKEKYIVIDELLSGDNLSTATSDEISQGESSTASTRGSRESVSGISFAYLDLEKIGNIKDTNKMETLSSKINEEKWEEFRKNGKLGEFKKLPY